MEMDRWSRYRNQMRSLVDEMAAHLQALRTGRFTLVLIFFADLLTIPLKRNWTARNLSTIMGGSCQMTYARTFRTACDVRA